VRRLSSREDNYLGQTIERLDRVSRAMNPLLLFVAVSLVVLNLACVLNLIDWRNLPPPPVAVAASPDDTVAKPAPVKPSPPASEPRAATSPD
jgi:hypothetical protein